LRFASPHGARMTHRASTCLSVTGWLYGLAGIALAIAGAWLLRLGGSPYYLLAGIGLAACGALVARGRAASRAWTAVVLLATLAWSLWEVGFDYWQLLPRLDLWWLLALWLVLPPVARRLGHVASAADTTSAERRGQRLAIGAALVLVVLVGAA